MTFQVYDSVCAIANVNKLNCFPYVSNSLVTNCRTNIRTRTHVLTLRAEASHLNTLCVCVFFFVRYNKKWFIFKTRHNDMITIRKNNTKKIEYSIFHAWKFEKFVTFRVWTFRSPHQIQLPHIQLSKGNKWWQWNRRMFQSNSFE